MIKQFSPEQDTTDLDLSTNRKIALFMWVGGSVCLSIFAGATFATMSGHAWINAALTVTSAVLVSVGAASRINSLYREQRVEKDMSVPQ